MSTPVAVTDANVITFIKTDPLHVGFAAILTANPGADQPLVDASNNASGPGAGTVAGDPMSKSDAFNSIAPAEWNVMTSAQLDSWNSLPDPIQMGEVNIQQDLALLFAGYATSLASFQTKFTRPGSPWEVYFGKGQVATNAVLDHARNSGAGGNF
jgi:hypothetical protein